MDPDHLEEEYEARLAALEDGLDGLGGRYGLVLERDGFEFLVDPRHLWMPPRVLVRRRDRTAEVWLWEGDVSFRRPSDFSRSEDRRILALVRDNLEELLDGWHNLRQDMRRGRLGRNLFVD